MLRAPAQRQAVGIATTRAIAAAVAAAVAFLALVAVRVITVVATAAGLRGGGAKNLWSNYKIENFFEMYTEKAVEKCRAIV